MLLKIIGSLIVLVSSGFLGYALSRDCSRRPGELRELQGMLQMFENEISYLSSLITDAFERICRSNQNEVSVFFKETVKNIYSDDSLNASQAWEKAVKGNIMKTSLNKEDEGVLISFGRMLGSSDTEGQIKNIRLALEQLKLQERKAEENRARNEMMFKRLGILGGIAIVIILI
jgi:stage III sporulation protein AB